MSQRYSRLASLVVATGVPITAADTTIVVLALPEIQGSLHIGLASVIWVIIGYLLVITVLSAREHSSAYAASERPAPRSRGGRGGFGAPRLRRRMRNAAVPSSDGIHSAIAW